MKLLSTLSGDKKKRVAAIDRAILEPIGDLTVNFALVESILKRGIEVLLFPNEDIGWAHETAAIVSSEMSFRKLLDLFQCLVRYRCSDSDADTCRALCAEMSRLEMRRNAIIHSNWGVDVATGSTIRMKTTAKGQGLKHIEEPIVTADIVTIADQLAELAKRFDDFISLDPAQEGADLNKLSPSEALGQCPAGGITNDSAGTASPAAEP